MLFARDYRFNVYTSGVGEEVAILESHEIRTRLFALKTPGGFEFRMHDDLNYPDIIACADWDRLLGMPQGAFYSAIGSGLAGGMIIQDWRLGALLGGVLGVVAWFVLHSVLLIT